ncbi:MAG: hypothetical protein CO013_01090 [Syntrophobacterales bacterium CG_4_8_14_3_um_filter_58_8]|nr:MAG: hypothetical protein AUK26_10815 [Syntrophaceae bacterium CG2_30_58_14]PIV04220.1 MAG: hypothetical protein COS57_09630 [Syntrophobacterales bacterium CG03_land_8_20_14_0_80_58_14]PJC75898.1 MAG: hypothetical protein CO013_01090 [Syntrophobacterales bacterium CG_4_8_14_3_um_filter_58_8]
MQYLEDMFMSDYFSSSAPEGGCTRPVKTLQALFRVLFQERIVSQKHRPVGIIMSNIKSLQIQFSLRV